MENPNNIAFVCPDCASRPRKKYAAMEVTFFKGEHVKVCFNEKGTSRQEHLWVFITSIKDERTLIGIIDNDPVLNLPVNCGILSKSVSM